jgi:hypothetical protein
LGIIHYYYFTLYTAKSNMGFDWFLFFHPDTPEWLCTEVNKLILPCRFHPVFISPAKFADEYGTMETPCLTTRLDNDDALDKEAMAIVKREYIERKEDIQVFNFEKGFQLDIFTGKLYEVLLASPPFSTIYIAPGNNPFFFGGLHNLLLKQYKKYQVLSSDIGRYLQCIHESNVCNRLQSGRLVSQNEAHLILRDNFGIHRLPESAGLLKIIWWRYRKFTRRVKEKIMSFYLKKGNVVKKKV